MTVTFDTNYLRSLESGSYLEGALPQILTAQVHRIFERGDLVVLTNTVRLEFSAYLMDLRKKRLDRIEEARVQLVNAGYTVSATDAVRPDHPVDVWDLFKRAHRGCELLEPTLADYREAEMRTSYRKAPHPKKENDEEMRDRLMWCQLVNYAKASGNEVLIVSNDEIFVNGASTPEGNNARISCVRNGTDLDQRLGARPETIAGAIKWLLDFGPQLAERQHGLDETDVASLDDLRKVARSDGSVDVKFTLLLKNAEHELNGARITLNVVGNEGRALKAGDLELVREITAHRDQLAEWRRNTAMDQLRAMLRGSHGR